MEKLLEISALKKEYAEILAGCGFKGEPVIFALSDLTLDATPGVALLCAGKDSITAVSGTFFLAESEDGIHSPRRVFNASSAVTVSFDDFDELRLEELISTGRVIACSEKEEKVLAMCTFSAKNDMILFVKYCMQLKQGAYEGGEPGDFSPELFCPVCGRRYANPASKTCLYCRSGAGIVKKFAIFAKKYAWRVALMLALLLIVSGIGVITPYFSSTFFYDRVLAEGDPFYGKILMVVLIVAGIEIAEKLVNMAARIITAKTAGFLVYDLKVTIFEAMKRLSLDFFTGRQTGGLMTQINEDSQSIHWFFVEGLSYYVVSIAKIIVVAIVMFTMQPGLAAVCVAVLPLFFWLALKTLRRQHYLHFKRHAAARRFNGRLTDSMGAIKVTKAFAMEKQETDRFKDVTEDLAASSRRIIIFRNIAPPGLRLVMYISTILVWLVGGWLTIKGHMTYGFFAAFLSYCNMLNSPLYSLADMMDSFADFANALRRLFEIYDAEPSVKESGSPSPKDTVKGEIEFRDVCFSYEKNRRIIDHVSFKVPAGGSLGIVGHSGAGKSTIANLLLRLYDTESGSIMIDGENIKDISVGLVRDNIAIVSQETYIFEGTIYDNIAYAKEDASPEEVVEAARLAGAHEFIVKLEEAYQTKVGLGGKNLSGGERQRISIARAILKKPAILVLDEATASMDTKTERMIQLSLDMLSRDRTTITIAHRLSTLSGVDKIIVIENGRLCEEGTSAELIMQDGIYRRLYMLQIEAMKNIIEEDDAGHSASLEKAYEKKPAGA
ncbi:MAG: ABC transporter ATP-binding protein [Clostridia bacterium]|nr:ABC transporter ATP-binding protein [Clostridia bacterium]